MEREEIVRQVAAEVARRMADSTLASAPRTLALVEPGPSVRRALQTLLGWNESVTAVLVSRAAQAPEATAFPTLMPTLSDVPDHLEQEVLPGVGTLLLPCLRPVSAARIALGMDSGTVPRLASAALWAGKRIVVIPGWPASGGLPAYRALYDGYLERLRSYGVEVLGAPGPVSGPAHASEAGLGEDVQTYTRRLLTEADVIALASRGTLRLSLPPGTLVTALASDAARMRGLQLERR